MTLRKQARVLVLVEASFGSMTSLRMVRAESPRQSVLTWNAPSSCPSIEQVLTKSSQYLGREPDAIDGVMVRANVARRGERFELQVETQSSTGRRIRLVDAERCEVLADATALIVAVAIDPTVGSRLATRPQTAPAPPSAPESRIQREGSVPAVSTAATMEATAQAAVGALPDVAPGFGVAFGVRRRSWRIEATGSWFPSRRARLMGTEAGGDLQLGLAGVRACGTRAWGALEVPICVGAQAGAMAGRGFGVDEPERPRIPWFSLSAGSGLRVMLVRRLALVVGIEAVFPLIRPRFVIDAQGLVHSPAPVAGMGSIGLEVRLP